MAGPEIGALDLGLQGLALGLQTGHLALEVGYAAAGLAGKGREAVALATEMVDAQLGGSQQAGGVSLSVGGVMCVVVNVLVLANTELGVAGRAAAGRVEVAVAAVATAAAAGALTLRGRAAAAGAVMGRRGRGL